MFGRVPLQRFSAIGAEFRVIAGHGLARSCAESRLTRHLTVRSRFVSAGGTRRRIGFLRRVHPTRRVASRAFASPVSIWDRDRRRDEPSVSAQPVTTAAPHATSSARPNATAIATRPSGPPELALASNCRTSSSGSGKDRPGDPPLMGRCSLQRISSGAAFVRSCQTSGWAASTLRTAGAVGRGRIIASAESPRSCICCVHSSLRFFAWRFVPAFRDARDSEFGVITPSGASTAARSVGSTSP